MSKFYEKREIEVDWTGAYPNLCSGSWIIKINGVQLVDKTDDTKGEKDWTGNPREFTYGHFMTEDMGTEGSYSSWHFTDDYDVVTDDYYDGESNNNWYKSTQGKNILELLQKNNITLNKSELEDLYQKISDEDWRSGSCGGCI